MKILKRVCFILIFSTLLLGCTVRHGDFTVLSNKLINTQDFNLTNAGGEKVIGEDVQHIIIFIPTSGPPTLEGAIDDAMFKSNGDVLTDAVIKSWSFYIPYIYGQAGWEVTGTAIKTRK